MFLCNNISHHGMINVVSKEGHLYIRLILKITRDEWPMAG